MTDYVSKYTLLFKDLASKGLLRVAAVSKAMTRGLQVASTALATVGAVGALAAIKLSNAFSERADEIAKFTKETGFAAKSMQELDFIADRQGAKFETVKKGVQKFNKALGELRGGTGDLVLKLKFLNPELKKQLLGIKSNEDAYWAMLKAIAETPDAADKAALASGAFGAKGAAAILRITAQGVDGLEKLRAEATKFRPPLSAAQLKMAEKYQDSLTNLKAVFGSLGDSAGGALLPIMDDLAVKFANFVVENREMINLKISDIFSKISDSMKKVDFKQITEGAQKFVIAGGQLITKSVTLIDKLGGVGNIAKGLLAIFVVGKVVAFAASFAVLAVSLKGTGPFFLMMAGNIKKVALAMKILMGAMGPIPLIITGIILAGVLLYKNWEKVKGFALKLGVDLDKVWLGIKGVVVKVASDVVLRVSYIIKGFKLLLSFGSKLAKGFGSFMGSISGEVGASFSKIKIYLSKISLSVKSKMSSVKSSFLLLLGPIGLVIKNYSKLKDGFANISSGVSSGISNTWQGIKGVLSNTPQIFSILPSSFGQSVKALQPFFKSMSKGFSSNLNGIKSLTTNTWEGIKSVIESGVNFWIGKINNILKVYNDFVTGPIGRKLGLAETKLINRVELNNAANSRAAQKGSVEVTLKGKVDGAQVSATTRSSGIATAVGSNAPFGRLSF